MSAEGLTLGQLVPIAASIVTSVAAVIIATISWFVQTSRAKKIRLADIRRELYADLFAGLEEYISYRRIVTIREHPLDAVRRMQRAYHTLLFVEADLDLRQLAERLYKSVPDAGSLDDKRMLQEAAEGVPEWRPYVDAKKALEVALRQEFEKLA